jgi:HEAT repeat protein
MRSAILLALLLSAAACGQAITPDQAVGELRNPDPNVRRNAADALRTPEGVPPQAVPALLSALTTEVDPPVRGAILITLGRSGAAEAKPAIDQSVMAAADKNMQRWTGRALRYWMIQTKQFPPDYAFPNDWPFGQPGFPPVVR